MKDYRNTGFIQTCLLMAVFAFANAVQADEDVRDAIQKSIQKARPDFVVKEVQKTDIANIYEVYLGNGGILYATKDGRYFIEGKILKVDRGEFVDMRDEKMKPLRSRLLADVPAKEMIVFSPAGETKAVIDVFTDVDCGYCQKLHSHINEFNALGIEVRYLAFPRAGPNSISAKKLGWAWCAEDPRDALTKLKARQKIPEATCNNPVASQYALGEKVGVTGTPAVFTKDGSLVGGYLPPDQMAAALGLK